MTKKSPPLPSSGGSYIRQGTSLKRVQEPTKVLDRNARKAAEKEAQADNEETSK